MGLPVGTLPLPSFILQDGLVKLANALMIDLTEYTWGELSTIPFSNLVHPEDRACVNDFFACGGLAATRDFSIISRSGRRIFCEAAFLPAEHEGSSAALVQVVDVTKHRARSEALAASELRYQETVDSLAEVVFELDMQGNLLFANRRAYDFWGITRESYVKGIRPLDYIAPEDRERCMQNMMAVACGAILGATPYCAQRADGARFPVLIKSSAIVRQGTPVGIRGVILDDTARKQRDDLLSRYNLLSEYSRDIILFIKGNCIVEANHAAVQVYGWLREELLSMSIDRILTVHAGVDPRLQQVEGNGGAPFEAIHRRKDGSVFPVEVTSQVATLGGESITIAIVRDISERKQSEQELAYLSLHDPLTNLFNRAYFEQETRCMEACPPAGIIVCDADGLKLVNDTLGHGKGDALLVAIAGAIRKSVRKGDIVARIGGDEFAVLLRDCDLKAVEEVCLRIRNAIKAYNELGTEVALSVSIGSAFDGACQDVNALFREADYNMYREKLQRSQSTRAALVQTLMKSLERRDSSARHHADRVHDLVAALATASGVPRERLGSLSLLARFHDIGKVGIPDRILLKPGSLTRSERAEMWRHCEIGHRIARACPDLATVSEWILSHHEWWNGQGYPLGLKGEDIPLECRIIAIVDAYDAMTSDRPYRRAMTHADAVKELLRCAGTQFDPRLVSRFVELVRGEEGQPPAQSPAAS